MRTRLLYFLIALTVLFTACKKDEGDDGTAILEATNVLDMADEKFLEYGAANVLSPQQALMETAMWLETQEGVASLYTIDSMIIMVKTTGGLEVSYQYMPVGANSLSLYRGGGGSGVSLKQFAGGSCTNPLENDKVLLFAPAENEFYKYGDLEDLATRIGSTSKQLKVTILRNAQCTPAKVREFANYGLVIMDTHGVPDGFLTGSNVSFTKKNKPADEASLRNAVNNQVGSDAISKINSGEYRLGTITQIKDGQLNWLPSSVATDTKYDIYVTSKFIKTIPKLSNTIVLANMCYSGYNLNTYESNTIDPIRPAFLGLDPLSYYCFARADGSANAVSNIFATKMENALVGRLIIAGDSTKISHLKTDNATEYLDSIPPSYKIPLNNFKHFGKDTYCYQCGGTFVDARDGKSYRTVCIGSQVWMADNLNYDAPGSVCYDNDPANCTTYGKLYDWATVLAGAQGSYASPSGVQGVCPQGWHLPSENECLLLFFNLGGGSVAGGAMKETTGWNPPNVGATNSSGFNGKAGGEFLGGPFGFTYKGEFAMLWTATPSVNSSTSALSVRLSNADASASIFGNSKTEKLSCRCVKD